MKQLWVVFLGLFLVFSLGATAFAAPKKLPALGLSKDFITVSGISSGGFMAVQLAVAYSDRIKGVGVIAGGIYGCSEGKTETAAQVCMKDPAKINVATYVDLVKNNFQKGLIDNPANLAQQRVFILSGSEDKTILPVAGEKLKEFYQQLKNTPIAEFSLKMGHGFPSPKGTVACPMSQFPWMNNCNYDGAKAILEALYGSLKKVDRRAKASGQMLEVDQNEFAKPEAKMLDYGHLYIPQVCKNKKASCRLHVAIHGCLQGPNLAKKSFVQNAGYNEWADKNEIVVFYPAVAMGTGNPNGCWDWFGYTGENFAVKSSHQMTAIMAMVNRLTEN